MTWWEIVLLCAICLAALVTAVFSMKVGAELSANGTDISFSLLLGPLRIDPKRLKKKKNKTTVSEKPKEEVEKPTSPKAGGQKLFQTIKPVLEFFLPRLQIERLVVTYRIGGREDPFGASLRYGEAQALYGVLVSGLENLCKVKKRELKCGVDYGSDQGDASLFLTITVRVWDGLRFLFTFFKNKT